MNVRPYGKAVDHDLDVVPEVAVQRGHGVEGVDLAVNPRAGESSLPRVVEDALVLPLAVLDHRRQDEEAGALVPFQDEVHHLLNGLPRERPPTLGAVGLPDARVQQPQVVVDLGDRAHRRPGIVRAGLLVDGDGRREALDLVHVRLLQLPQKLPGIGGEGFHVAPLPLGVEGVEGQAGLAGAGDTRDDDELVARNLDVDVLEVVLARAADDDGVFGHNPLA